jgi:uncharacterized membrane protein
MNALRVRQMLAPPYARVALSLGAIPAVVVALPAALRLGTRLLLGFNAGAVVYLALLAVMISGADASEVRAHARRATTGRIRVLVGALLAGGFGIGAVVFVLRAASKHVANYRTDLVLSAVTIFAAWLVLQCVFSLYYAQAYYRPALDPSAPGQADADAGGVQFAGPEAPDYWDFVYFSFTIGTCYATSDTPIASRHIRRAALLQMLVSFMFYTFLVGMVINAIGALLAP